MTEFQDSQDNDLSWTDEFKFAKDALQRQNQAQDQTNNASKI